MNEHHREYQDSIRTAGVAIVTAAVALLVADPALAQGIGTGVGAMPSGRFVGVATTTLGYICITIGIVCVALGLAYGIFQTLFRGEGPAVMIKSLLAGSFFGLVLPLAVWTVGSSPSTATIPEPGAGGFGGLGGIF